MKIRGFFLFSGDKNMLEILRTKIDVIDVEIVGLLKQRCAISRKIGDVKAAAGLPITDTERETDVLGSVASLAECDAERVLLTGIYSLVLSASRDIQSRTAAAELATR